MALSGRGWEELILFPFSSIPSSCKVFSDCHYGPGPRMGMDKTGPYALGS